MTNTATKQRVCFDVTLMFFSAFQDQNLHPAHETPFDDLVKWIVSPNEDALATFLKKSRIGEHLDAKPSEMSDHASQQYDLDDGVDVVLGRKGNVLRPKDFNPKKWFKQVLKAAEDFYGDSIKWRETVWAQNGAPCVWRGSGKYSIDVSPVGPRSPIYYHLTHWEKPKVGKTIGAYASPELAMVAALQHKLDKPILRTSYDSRNETEQFAEWLERVSEPVCEGEVSVCAHRVSYSYRIGKRELTDQLRELLEEHAEERAKACIIEGYVEGELNCWVQGEEDEDGEEVRGWWQIER